MIPEYMRFYSCTVESVLNGYARTFFALLNSMHEIKAGELLDDIITGRAVNSSDNSTIDSLRKQHRGLGAIVAEVKIAKMFRGKK